MHGAPLHAMRQMRRDRPSSQGAAPIVRTNALRRVRGPPLLHLPGMRTAARALLDRLPRQRLRGDSLLVMLGRMGAMRRMRGVPRGRRLGGGRGRRAALPKVRRKARAEAHPPLLLQTGAHLPPGIGRRSGLARTRNRARDGRRLCRARGEGDHRARQNRLPLLQARFEPRRRRRARHPSDKPRRPPVTRREGALAQHLQGGRGRGHKKPRHEDMRPARAREQGLLRTEPDRPDARRVQDARARRPPIRAVGDIQQAETRAAQPLGTAARHPSRQRGMDSDRAARAQNGQARPLPVGEHPKRGDHRATDVPRNTQARNALRDIRPRGGHVLGGEGAHPMPARPPHVVLALRRNTRKVPGRGGRAGGVPD